MGEKDRVAGLLWDSGPTADIMWVLLLLLLQLLPETGCPVRVRAGTQRTPRIPRIYHPEVAVLHYRAAAALHYSRHLLTLMVEM